MQINKGRLLSQTKTPTQTNQTKHMENNIAKTNIDKLIAKAKALHVNDRRSLNRGRPYVGLPESEAKIIGQIRSKTFGKVSLKSIFEVMSSEKLTRYKNYGTFNAAWKNHLAEKN